VTAKGNRSKSVKGLPIVIPVEEPCKGKPKAVAQPCFFYFLKVLKSKLLALLENKKTFK